eukprot:m51a1_g6551 hypothetical protein (537) ;mRNA; r:85018-86857
MQQLPLALLSLLAGPALCATVFTQYNSASDTSLAMRTAIAGTCKDLYATTRVYSDAQFMFREVPALDGGNGVSIMPASNPGYYLCSDGTGSGRICSFKKVAGLSNPSLVSFEQGGQYIGYAKAYDYDCASWFTNYNGWTVGLVDKPANPTLATWISADAGPVRPYIQGTQSWLGNCGGSAFFTEQTGDTLWEVVPALSNASSSTLVSLQLSGTSLHLGIDADGAQQMDNSSVAHVPVRAMNCSGREALCTWTMAVSAVYSGDFNLKLAGGSRTLDLTANNTLSCKVNYGAATMSLSSCAELGFLRATYSIPKTPAVILNESSSSAEPAKCSDNKLCRTCIVTTMSCGWCEETGLCVQGTATSPSNCSKSHWFFESCVAATPAAIEDAGSTSIMAPLIGGIVGGVAALSVIAVGVVLIARSVHKRQQAPPLNMPVEGASVDFTTSSRDLSLRETISPMGLQLSGSMGGTLPNTSSSGSGPAVALSLGVPPVYDISLMPSLSTGQPSLEVPPPLGGFPLGGLIIDQPGSLGSGSYGSH